MTESKHKKLEMDLKSVEEVEGYAALRADNKIRNIEEKLRRLSLTPYIVLASVVLYAAIVFFFDKSQESWMAVVFLGALIFAVDHKNIQRTELLKELFQLKYGK